MSNAFDPKTTVIPNNASVLVTQLGRRATIHHLPVEILAEIFVHCIPLLVPDECNLPSLEIYPSEIRDILSDVCRLWSMIIDREPRVWTTLAFNVNSRPDPKVVSACLNKSNPYPLDVYIGIEYASKNSRNMLSAIAELMYNELPRIRTLFASEHFINIFSTFSAIRDGHNVLMLPRVENLNLINLMYCKKWKARLSLPQLHTLALRDFRVSIDGPMPSVRHLFMAEYRTLYGSARWSSRFLRIVPNLVSLTWSIEIPHEPLEPPVVLPSLRSLRLPSYGTFQSETFCALRCFVAPSLDTLDLDLGISTTSLGHELMLTQALDVICREGPIRLRELTLRCIPKSLDRGAIPRGYLDHLDTLTFYDTEEITYCFMPGRGEIQERWL